MHGFQDCLPGTLLLRHKLSPFLHMSVFLIPSIIIMMTFFTIELTGANSFGLPVPEHTHYLLYGQVLL